MQRLIAQSFHAADALADVRNRYAGAASFIVDSVATRARFGSFCKAICVTATNISKPFATVATIELAAGSERVPLLINERSGKLTRNAALVN